MRRGVRRVLFVTSLGASSGALAAWIAYMFRKPEPIGAPGLSVKLEELTLSRQTWAIVGLSLLGALVCGSITATYVAKKGLARTMLAVLIAAPIGALLCWGSRWVMDQMLFHRFGGPETRIDQVEAMPALVLAWAVWQICIGFGMTIPVVIAIGVNWFTVLRGLIGAGLVIVFGFAINEILSFVVVAMLLPTVLSGGVGKMNSNEIARVADVLYLFSLGAAAGLAFAFAEAIWKPAWLKSYGGPTEGRAWTLGEFSRIGSMEGTEVFLPPDGYTAPIHAQIQSSEDGHCLVDVAGSTHLNGVHVQSTWLNDGDRIGIGSYSLVFRTRLTTGGRPAARVVEPSPVMRAAQQVAVASPTAPSVPMLKDPLGNKHPIRSGKTVIGRDASCDLALTWEATVSKRHAEITYDTNGLFVDDLGSTNGTFVNEQRVSSLLAIKVGDVLRLGQCRLTIK